MEIIGYVLSALGLLYIGGGLFELLLQVQEIGVSIGGAVNSVPIPDAMRALARLVGAPMHAPEWLASCVVGLLLTIAGFLLVRHSRTGAE
jgi:hypothetical protein